LTGLGVSLAAVGEFGLIEKFFAAPAREMNAQLGMNLQPLLGIGDDCALLAATERDSALAISTDMLVLGRHFFADVDPVSLGHKALAVNLSDLAAMGARPIGFTLALALPDQNNDWLQKFSQGMMQLARRMRCPLLGGDTTRGPLTISITVIGQVMPHQALRRDRALPGDSVWVSGQLGAAAYAVDRLSSGEQLLQEHPARRALEWPEPRLSLGLALAAGKLAHAAIDLSDGLLGDLAHILERSQIAGAVIDLNAIPWAACLGNLPEAKKIAYGLSGGDDYELLFTAAPEHDVSLQQLGRELGLSLQRIGALCTNPGVFLRDAAGRLQPAPAGAFDHFKDLQ
jgi:thiamine-monophosphate kinase